jgi:hypothetical protein
MQKLPSSSSKGASFDINLFVADLHNTITDTFSIVDYLPASRYPLLKDNGFLGVFVSSTTLRGALAFDLGHKNMLSAIVQLAFLSGIR